VEKSLGKRSLEISPPPPKWVNKTNMNLRLGHHENTVHDLRDETVTMSGELNQLKGISNSISSDEYSHFATRKIIILKMNCTIYILLHVNHNAGKKFLLVFYKRLEQLPIFYH
jgi:hypothetical protein